MRTERFWGRRTLRPDRVTTRLAVEGGRPCRCGPPDTRHSAQQRLRAGPALAGGVGGSRSRYCGLRDGRRADRHGGARLAVHRNRADGLCKAYLGGHMACGSSVTPAGPAKSARTARRGASSRMIPTTVSGCASSHLLALAGTQVTLRRLVNVFTSGGVALWAAGVSPAIPR